MAPILIIFAISVFILGHNLLYPTTTTKAGVTYTHDILGRITKVNTMDYSRQQLPVATPNPYTIKFDLTKVK